MAKNKTRNFFVWIIMGLLFVGLIGFGSVGLTGNVRTVGSAGEKPITVTAYFNELQAQISAASAQTGQRLSFPQAEAQGIPLRALQSVVVGRVLDNEIAQMGVSIGDDRITEQVLSNPAFRDGEGNFDPEIYRIRLQDARIAIRDYETSIREETARAMLQGAVFSGIPEQETYGTTLAKFVREARDFTWVAIGPDDVEITLPAPTDADLLAYYEANPEEFTAPETRELTYIWLSPAMIQDDVPVDEDELRAEYEARLAEYVQPERRLVERLVFSDEETAAAAMASIEAGETSFPELVEERGLTLNDVDLGDLTQTQLGAAGEAVFALNTGDVAGPFMSDLGPALFRMNAILAARETTFEDALPELREDQAAARARRLIEAQFDPIGDLLAGGASFDVIAEQTDAELGTLDWTVETTEGIAAYSAFREAVQDLNVGAFPQLLELEDGSLFSVRADAIRPPTLIPLEEVRTQLEAAWQAEARQDALMEIARDAAAQLEGGAAFADLDLPEALQESAITRRSFINGTPPTFVSSVFEMDVGDVQVIEGDGAAILVQLDAVSAADDTNADFTAAQESFAETGGAGIAQDIFELFNRDVQRRTEVDIDEAAVNAVHTNFR